jgi:hypothetical protein
MIFSLLAESPNITPPSDFSGWLANFMYLIVSVTSVVVLAQKARKQPATQSEITNSPLTVEKKPTYATTEELAALKKQVETLSQKMESEYRALLQAGALREASIKDAIHTMKDHLVEKIDDALKQSYHRINEHETRLSQAEGKLGYFKRPRD